MIHMIVKLVKILWGAYCFCIEISNNKNGFLINMKCLTFVEINIWIYRSIVPRYTILPEAEAEMKVSNCFII